MRRTQTLARQALTDAVVTATLIDAALHALDLGLAGWPEQTPGASPASGVSTRGCTIPDCDHMTLSQCQLHGDGDPATFGPPSSDNREHQLGHSPAAKTTATERLAMQSDQARRDLEILQHAIRSAARALTITASICHRWGLDGVTNTDVKEGLAEKVNEIWCANCAKAGLSTVRIQGRTDCRFCAEVRQKGTCGVANPNHYPAPKSLLEIHVRRRLNSADFTRCMAAEYGLSWNKKMKKGKAA